MGDYVCCECVFGVFDLRTDTHKAQKYRRTQKNAERKSHTSDKPNSEATHQYIM